MKQLLLLYLRHAHKLFEGISRGSGPHGADDSLAGLSLGVAVGLHYLHSEVLCVFTFNCANE